MLLFFSGRSDKDTKLLETTEITHLKGMSKIRLFLSGMLNRDFKEG